MKWLEGLSPLRFALLVIAAFAVAASLAWSFANPNRDEPRPTPVTLDPTPFVPATDAPAVTTEVP